MNDYDVMENALSPVLSAQRYIYTDTSTHSRSSVTHATVDGGFTDRIGSWPSRDPIGTRGGRNLYAFVGNRAPNAIDVVGLKTYCTFDKTKPASDTGWKFSTYYPDIIVSGGGGTYSQHTICVFKRTITTSYKCSCCPNKSRTILYGRIVPIYDPQVWYVPGGTFALPDPSDFLGAIGDLIKGKLFPPMIDPVGAKQIESKCKKKAGGIAPGNIVDDSGHPYCK